MINKLIFAILMMGFIGASLSLAGCESDGRYDAARYPGEGDGPNDGAFSRGHSGSGTSHMNSGPTSDILSGGL